MKRDNNEIVKIYRLNLKLFLSRTTGQILTKPGTKHNWVKEIHGVFFQMKVYSLFQGKILATEQKCINEI